MFVMNCSVDHSEVLSFPEEKPKQSKKKQKKNKKQKLEETDSAKKGPETNTMDTVAMVTEDTYYPVRCTECTTQVGVFDKEEVYHFFNVLTGYS